MDGNQLFRQVDGCLLGITRMGFGLLMFIDCFVERGLHIADHKWTDDGCQFPLFNWLKPLSSEWMTILQFVQGIGALFIFIGFRVRRTGWLFIIPYWYMFLLDKTHWNNHSYLFGLMGILFTIIESDQSASVSGTNKMIPMWNYYLIRFQIFILYFYAGIKKTESDWLLGYSMGNLSRKWVFDPFRSILTNEQIDLFIVHIGGFVIDFATGPMLLFDRTRPIAILILSSFHCMNSQMFSIGMFPYACLATMFIFCRPNSPRNLRFIPVTRAEPTKTNEYRPNKKFWFSVIYVAIQAVLPYSHFVTEGYNGWTQGAYGYSWDMMIHSFKKQHVKITYEDGATGEVGYLKPNAFIGRARDRYTMHPDMLKQYATCLVKNLESHNVTQPKIYFDIWKSMNERFVQRVYDPRIDVAAYNWKWNKRPAYTMPLLNGLADWRGRLKELRKEIADEDIDVTFIADHPGLTLENYIAPDLDKTTVELMGGQAKITLDDQEGKEIEMTVGEKYHVPAGQFHTVHCLGDNPAMYMYIYQNSTDVEYRKKFKVLREIDQYDSKEDLPSNLTNYFTPEEESQLREYFYGSKSKEEIKVARKEKVVQFKKSFYGKTLYWCDKKIRNVRRGVLLVYYAINDLINNRHVCKDPEKCDPVDFYERLSILDEWVSPFRSAIINKIDFLSLEDNVETTSVDDPKVETTKTENKDKIEL